MGCCLSTLDETEPKPNRNRQLNSIEKNQQFPCVSKSPPRPEEETVKEVLSETPTPKPKPDPKPEPEIILRNDEIPRIPKLVVSPKKPVLEKELPHLEQKLVSLEQKLPFIEQKVVKKESKHIPEPTTPSEVSELCSLSETISNTTLDENHQSSVKDSANSGEVRQRVYRSQGQISHLHHSKFNNNSNNLRRSPVRKVDPSPPRRRYPGPGGPAPKRDVSGGNSARRSRSPAARSNVGRSPSGRRTGPSPGRVRMVGGPGPENVSRNGNENENEGESEGVKESLENPLVSLECFIFL